MINNSRQSEIEPSPEPEYNVLIIDDEAPNIRILSRILRNDYHISSAVSGIQALRYLSNNPLPNLILLDVMMPAMDGFELCQELKKNPNTRDIPVIFVTAMNDPKNETLALKMGAVDFISKPVSPAVVLARVNTHIALQEARKSLAGQNTLLGAKVRERTRELERSQEITILSMATLAETRDNETGNHIHRTQHYVKVIAEQLHDTNSYPEQLSDSMIESLYKSVPLHDIGKVGVADNILKKNGKLNEQEFAEMKRHTTYGRDAIMTSESKMDDQKTSFLQVAREIAYSHHEKWDGSGYPQGLSGEDIPLSARITAVGDVYDALISKRVYKPAFSHEKAVEFIREGKGTHFDPLIIEAFEQCLEKFKVIALKYSD